MCSHKFVHIVYGLFFLEVWIVVEMSILISAHLVFLLVHF